MFGCKGASAAVAFGTIAISVGFSYMIEQTFCFVKSDLFVTGDEKSKTADFCIFAFTVKWRVSIVIDRCIDLGGPVLQAQ